MLSRWRFPTLPRQFQISLRSTYTDQRTGGQTTQAQKVVPLFEFNGTFPAMSPELFQIYRLARIKAINISMEVINTSSVPLTATLCCLPLTIAQGVTDPRNISSIPGSLTRQVGISTGMSRSHLTKTFVGEKELGQSALSGKEYSQTFSEALLPAVETDLPAIYSGVISTVNSASWTGVINYVYTWHIEFTEYTTGLTGSHDPSESEKMAAKYRYLLANSK